MLIRHYACHVQQENISTRSKECYLFTLQKIFQLGLFNGKEDTAQHTCLRYINMAAWRTVNRYMCSMYSSVEHLIHLTSNVLFFFILHPLASNLVNTVKNWIFLVWLVGWLFFACLVIR